MGSGKVVTARKGSWIGNMSYVLSVAILGVVGCELGRVVYDMPRCECRYSDYLYSEIQHQINFLCYVGYAYCIFFSIAKYIIAVT